MKLDDIIDAIEFASVEGYCESGAFISKIDWTIHFKTDDVPDDFPEDVWDINKYISVPSWRWLDIRTNIVFDFALDRMTDHYEEIREIFSRKGAYKRFRVFLIETDSQQLWYDYEKERKKSAAIEWAKSKGILLEDIEDE